MKPWHWVLFWSATHSSWDHHELSPEEEQAREEAAEQARLAQEQRMDEMFA